MTRALELLSLAEGALRIVVDNLSHAGKTTQTFDHAFHALGYVEELDRLLRYNAGRSEGVGAETVPPQDDMGHIRTIAVMAATLRLRSDDYPRTAANEDAEAVRKAQRLYDATYNVIHPDAPAPVSQAEGKP